LQVGDVERLRAETGRASEQRRQPRAAAEGEDHGRSDGTEDDGDEEDKGEDVQGCAPLFPRECAALELKHGVDGGACSAFGRFSAMRARPLVALLGISVIQRDPK